MSKNIEEIVNIAILKYDVPDFSSDDMDKEMGYGYGRGWNDARGGLKQAITEGKLVVPMSEKKILDVIKQHLNISGCEVLFDHLVKHLYESQFNDKR